MHPNTYRLMDAFRHTYAANLTGLHLLEVGSRNVNGSYRPIFEGTKEYVGLDIEAGACVTIVSEPFHYPFNDNSFDIVISGQALEHSPRPWRMIEEMARILKPGGYICLIAPWQWEVHRYPVDCFRILSDGMAAMMRDAGLDVIACHHSENDCIGIGSKAAKADAV